MNENQTLEMQMKANAQQAISSLNQLLKSLGLVEDNISKITTTLDSNGKTTVKSLTSIEKEGNKVYKVLQKIDKDGNLKTVSTTMTTLKNKTDNASNSVSKLSKTLSLGGTYLGAKRITKTFLEWLGLAVDRTEQMNLFNVVFKNIEKDGVKTFSKLGEEATKFQYKLNEAFGTNLTSTMKYQGLFQSMGENVGIEDTYSAIMSETMTKLTYDLSSLYNKEADTVAEALRAGVYAGQTKPLRSYGVDVTQTSMQPILESLGITDRSVKQLSQAEKEILRYLATLEQAQIAMGDFANTIESPSNQMKIFEQQVLETKIAISSLFIGLFSDILPYANAFLMVIKEVVNAIADMFGIKLEDYNSGIASSEDAYVDLEESIDGATDAVKELKRQTLGFDQINNISENKDSGNNSITGGIDQRLLDAIKGYDNGMDKIKMRATEIRDNIMEWLGFHKEIDAETGETVWKLNDGYTNIEKIKDTVIAIGTALAGWKITKSVTDFLTWYGKNKTNLTKAMGITLTIGGLIFTSNTVGKLLDGDTSLGTALQGIISGLSVGAGTYMLTKSVTLTLLVTSITLVAEADISLKNLWKEMEPLIEENGGLWQTWKDGAKIAIDEIGKGLGNLKDNIETKVDDFGRTLLRNEEDWGTWKEEIGILWDIFTLDFKGMTDTLLDNFGKLKDEIDKNGGAWESWKQGVGNLWQEAKDKFSEIWNNSPFGQLNNALQENGGYWENWKLGINKIVDTVCGWLDNFKKKIDETLSSFGKLADEISNSGGAWENWKRGIGVIFGGLFKADGGIYSNGSWKNIQQYANGGSPSHGTMFVAGESGAEIVGHINGKTEVLNQSQIASAIYSAVLSAMSQSGGQTSQIDVYVHTDEGTVVDRINQTTKQTGVCPIDIPVY